MKLICKHCWIARILLIIQSQTLIDLHAPFAILRVLLPLIYGLSLHGTNDVFICRKMTQVSTPPFSFDSSPLVLAPETYLSTFSPTKPFTPFFFGANRSVRYKIRLGDLEVSNQSHCATILARLTALKSSNKKTDKR